MKNVKFKVSHLFAYSIFLITSLFLVNSCASDGATQEEKEALVASYLRLADLLKGVSGTVCEELAQYNNNADQDTITQSCQKIDEIIIRLKATNDLSEEQRNEYNQVLSGIMQRIINVAQMTSDQQLADKINAIRRSMEVELDIVRNKNINLNAVKSRAELAAQQARRERDAAIAAQKAAEKALMQYRSEHHSTPLSAAEQQRLFQLQGEAERSRRERDAAIANQKRLEQAQNDLKKELERAKAASEKGAKTETTISKPVIAESKKPATAANNPPTTASPRPILTVAQLKQSLQQQLGNVSPTHRNREERDQLRQLFASTSTETIYTESNSYSIDSYLDKLSLLGPYDVHIVDLKTDLQGKITNMKVEETRLNK